MAKWTYQLTVCNSLDRDLELVSGNVAWGQKDTDVFNFPRVIHPGEHGAYHIFSPAGRASGIEFSLGFSDVPPTGETQYGTIAVSVDMPYWNHKNTSSCKASGTLECEGFEEIPDGEHDFETTVIIKNSNKPLEV